MTLPVDSHVHGEWSWDARRGSLERTCARALELGMPAVVFTEHVDASPTVLDPEELDEPLRPLIGGDGLLRPPPLDRDGYLAAVEGCRGRFPGLTIVAGIELGDGHRADSAATAQAEGFGRVLGSLHSVPVDGRFLEPPELLRTRGPEQMLRDYLTELCRMVEGCDLFEVLAHIDFPLRFWPADAAPFDAAAFEDDFRPPLRLLAGSGRALEVNSSVPLPEPVLRWWREEGGRAVTFGSDAHEPESLGRELEAAAALAHEQGFRPASRPQDPWRLPA
ncbi:PHP domain-containing protein [Naasia sp. SYSU D00057]|uniref:PHP domain-containing protein n=1 Tax=Naasia sp. SYSU D00057 TaxID=2817380 RepID=UPI001B30DB4F|nr:PHP domain-containing protein [Naasia sp. SYSU D00057]